MKRYLLTLLSCLTMLVNADEPDTCFTSAPIPDEIFARMRGRSYPTDCSIPREELRYLRLSYRNAQGETCEGEMVCNRRIAADVVSIFRQLWLADYRIERMKLIDEYDGDDKRSMEANNTSCFNYRCISGTKKISKHGKGLAIDVNPLYNPCVRGQHVEPEGGKKWAFRREQRRDIPYKIDRRDLCYRLFTQHGFRWGGSWQSCKDYQHFEY